jgi:uncharacterized membrane protein
MQTIADGTTGAELPRARLGTSRPVVRAVRFFARLRTLSFAERVAYGSTCVYAAVFTFFAIVRHLAFQTGWYDLGTMTQAIWNTAHGHFLEGTAQTGEQFTRLAVHVDPFLVLLVPLWWMWSSPLMLVTLQALAVSAGALPVFWLARKHLASERAAVFFALAYLLFPATQFNALAVASDSGFHPVSIAIPLLLLAIWFLDEDRLVAFAVVGILAATTKEEIPLTVGLLGLWYAARRGKWRFGLSTLVAGLGLTLVDFLVVIPHFLGSSTFFGDRYAAVGGSPTGVLRTVFTDPVAVIHDVATLHKLIYVLLLFAPFLCLWLLEPLLALAAAPELVINLLSNSSGQISVAYHYTAAIVPCIVAASIIGLGRLRRQTPRLSLYVLAAVLMIAVYSPLRLGVLDVPEAFASNPIHRAKVEALSLIPAGVPVSASNQLGAHLSERRRFMLFPYAIRDAQWIVVDRADPNYDRRPYEHRIDLLRRDKRWRLIYQSHGVMVFRRHAVET